ncbi:hypothetical protein JCM17380_45600 [Desulfosporosinus burensis]
MIGDYVNMIENGRPGTFLRNCDRGITLDSFHPDEEGRIETFRHVPVFMSVFRIN